VLEVLTPIVQDSKVGIDVAGFAAMTLGLVYVGSCNEDVVQSIVLSLMEHTETELAEPLACFLCLGLGLGLLYLGKQVMLALFCSFLVESFYPVRLYLHN
jgi:26S proteasome regulatory subunit N1